MSEERDVLAARKAKMLSWQASVGTYPNEFRRQDLAADLIARHAPGYGQGEFYYLARRFWANPMLSGEKQSR